jgi:hypothetical protein
MMPAIAGRLGGGLAQFSTHTFRVGGESHTTFVSPLAVKEVKSTSRGCHTAGEHPFISILTGHDRPPDFAIEFSLSGPEACGDGHHTGPATIQIPSFGLHLHGPGVMEVTSGM